MDKLRKRLVRLSAVLSAVAAAAAVLATLWCPKGGGGFSKDGERVSAWGEGLQSKARKLDKLVLFTTREDLDESMLSPLARKCVSDKYILSKLEPSRYPADYEILKKLFNGVRGGNEDIAVGLLSPKMRPIYLSSKFRYDSRGRGNSLNRILPGAVAVYSKVSGELQDRAGRAAEILDASLPAGPLIPSGPVGTAFFTDIQSWNLLVLFGRPAALPAGVLAENARLAVLVKSKFPRQFCARKAADTAAIRVAEALLGGGTRMSAAERLVLLRAAAEISESRDYAALGDKCLETGLSLLKYQDGGGLFVLSGSSAGVAENALAVSFLAKLSPRCPDARFEKAARRCANALIKILDMPGEMPAVVDAERKGASGSQASSYGYAYLCSALADMHRLTGESFYLDALAKTAGEWRRFYTTRLGLFSVNSQNSALGGFLRPVLVEDRKLPSYLGEAAQVAAYLSRNGRGKSFPGGGRLAAMADAAFRQISPADGSYASFKIAALR